MKWLILVCSIILSVVGVTPGLHLVVPGVAFTTAVIVAAGHSDLKLPRFIKWAVAISVLAAWLIALVIESRFPRFENSSYARVDESMKYAVASACGALVQSIFFLWILSIPKSIVTAIGLAITCAVLTSFVTIVYPENSFPLPWILMFAAWQCPVYFCDLFVLGKWIDETKRRNNESQLLLSDGQMP